MHFMVTGGSGFLGRHVIARLRSRGRNVNSIDIIGPSDYVHVVDITDPEGLAAYRPYSGPYDGVIHLAAVANPREAAADPARAFDVNVRGTYNVLKWAVDRHASRFVFASSAHCYGIPPRRLPSKEDDPPCPFDVYTATKLLGEAACRDFQDGYGLSCVSLRLYNGYGPGQPKGYFVPDMIAQGRGGKITLHDAGTTKDFVYVDDMAEAIVRAAEGSATGVINIGSGVETPLPHVMVIVAETIVATWETESDGAPPPTRMRADIRRASIALGWRATTPMATGLEMTVKAGSTDA